MNCGIVSVEDNKTDAMVIRRTLKELTSESVTVLKDGEMALNFFKDDKNVPSLILMDINIPFRNGLELLEVIRSYEHLREVPVVMFSSSLLDEEIKQSYHLGANSYVAKPCDHESLEDALREIYN
ncbi:MAG TPA: response regulator, partial [Candidatus Methanofastidiosa archaeon]|nr:response regulator [Candidatus Methanofastidiosa archaeon]